MQQQPGTQYPPHHPSTGPLAQGASYQGNIIEKEQAEFVPKFLPVFFNYTTVFYVQMVNSTWVKSKRNLYNHQIANIQIHDHW